MTEVETDFTITLIGLTLEIEDEFDEADDYRAAFGVELDDRRFVITVWFAREACPTVDLVHFAMGRLHAVAAQLARQTEGWGGLKVERG